MFGLVQGFTKWLRPGLHIKRWLAILIVGLFLATSGGSFFITGVVLQTDRFGAVLLVAILLLATGLSITAIAARKLYLVLSQSLQAREQEHLVDLVTAQQQRKNGAHVVAIGGGTGLPSVLRALKSHTSNITAVVTVADDGGSSGRLRREHGVLPPGDLRNNIAALADDESLMTRLFQYRFDTGDLGGHSFGNLFITAMTGVTGSLERALVETERVLNIQGSVLPATLEDVTLVGKVRLNHNIQETITIHGESQISDAGGIIEEIALEPVDIAAFHSSVEAILNAELIVIGPGSLYTSILPNLLVRDIAEALRATRALKVYVCNVATQPGETDGYTVADHVAALEEHVGRGIFQIVLANNYYPLLNAGEHTHYVQPNPPENEIFQRYDIRYTDLTDSERPWRHDPQKLAAALIALSREERIGSKVTKTIFTDFDKAAIM